MDRREKLLERLDLAGPGLEIGPSHNPIAPKRLGYRVQVMDHLDREALVAKYREHGVDLSQIEEVDFVWNGSSYAELTGVRDHYSWIIASHVIEHTPDLIAFLNQCDEILGDEGVLSLAVPDKRYCFDHYRPLTSLGAVIESAARGDTIHSPGSVAEYFLNVTRKDGVIAWDAARQGEYTLVHTLAEARMGMASAIDGAYLDIHRWCFVPHSFRLLVQDLYDLGLTRLREIAFDDTQDFEFFMALGRQGKGLELPRIEVLEKIKAELAAVG